MPILRPTIEQYNTYIDLMLLLNLPYRRGKLDCDSAAYYDFLDKNRVSHQQMQKIVTICSGIYETGRYGSDNLYVTHRGKRDTGVEDGVFYLTTNGRDIVFDLTLDNFPVKMKEPKILDTMWQPGETHKTTEENLAEVRKNREKAKLKKEKEWTKEELVHLLTREAHIVGRMLGSGYDLLEPIHGEWIYEWIINPKRLSVMIHQAHRNSYKSTCLRLAIAILMILRPDLTIILIRKSEDAVKELMSGVSRVLGTGLFQKFTSILHPDIVSKGGLKKTTDTALIIDTNLNISLSGEPQLRGVGLGSPITGMHSKMIITDDICFVAGTKIATPYGDKNIEDLKAGDYVITPFGSKKITRTHSRKAEVITNCGLTGTYNHPVYNKNKNLFDNLVHSSYNNVSKLNLRELIKWKVMQILLNGMGENGKEQTETIISLKPIMDKGLVKCYTELFGKNILEKFLKGMLFIIKTIIHITIILVTYSVYRLMNIKECTFWNVWTGSRKILKKMQDLLCWNGLKQKKDKGFAERISKKQQKKTKRNFTKWQSARFAVKNIKPILGKQQECVVFAENVQPQDVLKKSEKQYKKQTQNTSMLNVQNVELFTEHALQQETKTDYARIAMKENDTEKTKLETVYNIEVEDEHIYYANGVLVHNCTRLDRESPAERMNTISVYREMMNVLSADKNFSDTLILNIGTPWHEEDAFSVMEKGLPDKCERQIRLENIPIKDRTDRQNEKIRRANMVRGLFVYSCYQTGLMSPEQIEQKKKVLNDDVLFAANYELTLVSDDEKPFSKINNVGNYTTEFFQNAWEVIATIDGAYGGTDSCSMSIGAVDWDNNTVVVLGKLYTGIALDKNYMELAEIMQNNNAFTLYMETNADKGLMGEKFRELGFDVHSYHESMNKHTKIVSTIRPYWREKGEECMPCVQFVQGTDADYLAQIHNYKKGVKHDDAPDNLACLLLKGKFGALAVRVT